MDEWIHVIGLYKTELEKEKANQEKRMKNIRKRLNKIKITKGILLQLLNTEISKLKSSINECKEEIETHNTLIEETRNGTLDSPDSD